MKFSEYKDSKVKSSGGKGRDRRGNQKKKANGNRAQYEKPENSKRPADNSETAFKAIELPNVLESRKGNSTNLFTRNLVPGFTNYDEDLVQLKGTEYRSWNTTKSKLAAAIAKGMHINGLKEDSSILYLGAASGTTVSHVSDIFTKGMIFAVEFSREPYLDLYMLSEKRRNIVPLFEDANNTVELLEYVPHADFIFMDVAQKNQVEILEKNSVFASKDSLLMIAVKARSINVIESPRIIFDAVREQLSQKFKILQEVSLEPYERDHRAFLLKKK